MKRDLINLPELNSSFLSCEKDTETILKKLFVDSRQYSDQLKRLLVINTKDCIDNKENEEYKNKIKSMSIAKLKEQGYIKLEPKIKFYEHEEVKAYLIISFDTFTPNLTNPEYRDCNLNFDIFCNIDYWDIGNYRLRPFKIAGIIDGLLNKTKLSGIGVLNFIGCNAIVFDENISGYTLSYRAIHMTDDRLLPEED